MHKTSFAVSKLILTTPFSDSVGPVHVLYRPLPKWFSNPIAVSYRLPERILNGHSFNILQMEGIAGEQTRSLAIANRRATAA